jgi:galactose mutarotase-like enzyme
MSHTIDETRVEGFDAYSLASDDGAVRATVVPSLAMLCWSLEAEGEEYLGRPSALDAVAREWATTGMPLLHPWANRLGGATLEGVGRPTVDPASALVPTDDDGLAIHGLNLAGAGWRVTETDAGERSARVTAVMDFSQPAHLDAFPFRHEVAVAAELRGRALTVTTRLASRADRPMPVSFGWHPYFRLPGVARADWVVALPVRRRADLDGRMLPTGSERPVRIPAGPLGDTVYDDLFTALDDPPVFRLSGGGRSLDVAFGDGYPYAQVYAPAAREVIAFEPMTSPTNAAVTGRGLRRLAPGATFEAAFTVSVRPRPPGGSGT